MKLQLKRIMSRSRLPIAELVARQRASVQAIDERIGRIMSERVEAEEILSDMIDLLNAVES